MPHVNKHRALTVVTIISAALIALGGVFGVQGQVFAQSVGFSVGYNNPLVLTSANENLIYGLMSASSTAGSFLKLQKFTAPSTFQDIFAIDYQGNITTTGTLTGANSVWQTNGNNIYNSNTGNVGIGTTNPGSYKLNVTGNQYVSGYLSSPNILSGIVYAESATLTRALNEPAGWVKIWDSGGGSVYTTNFRITGGYNNRYNNLEFRVTTSGYGQPHSIVMLPTTNYNQGTIEEIRTQDVSNTQLEVWVKVSAVESLYAGNITVYASDTGLVNPLSLTTTQPTWGVKSVAVYPQQDMGNLPMQLSSSIRSFGAGSNYFAGNVGVGTNAPGQKLDVGASTSDYIRSFGGFVGSSAANIGGTGAAAYFPSGVYIAGSTSWIYGTVNFNSIIKDNQATPRWSINPTGSSWFNGGNIGIGTTTPATKLYINGGTVNVLNVGGGFIAGLNSTPVNTDQAVPLGYLQSNYVPIGSGSGGVGSGTSGQTLRHNGTSWVANSILVNNGTNVGVGATNPAYKLDVSGNLRVAAGSSVAALLNSTADAQLTLQSSDTWTGIAFDDSGATNDYIWYGGTNGTFAIGGGGANVSGKKLHVDGGMSIGANSDYSAVPTNGLYVEGNVGIGTTAPLAKLQIEDTAAISLDTTSASNGNLIIKSNTGGRTTTSGAQLEFVIPANTDGSNPYGQGRIITVAGNSLSANATGKMILGTRRYINKIGSGSAWYYGDDLTIDGSGNVGIGTTSPITKLAVSGGTVNVLNVGGGFIAGLNSTPVNTDQAVPLGYIQSNYVPLGSGSGGVGSGTSGQTLRHNGTSWVANSTLYNNGTNVGVGTTSTNNKLDVNGGLRLQGAYNQAGEGLFMGYDTTNGGKIMAVNTGVVGKPLNIYGFPLIFSSSSSGGELMRLNGSGNLGIGVTNPSAKLEVKINNSGNDYFLYSNSYNNRGLRTGNGPFAGLFGFQNAGDTGSGDSYATIISMNAYYNGTNWYTLNGWIRPTSINVGQAGNITFFTETSSQAGVAGNYVPTERMRITSNGNVGMGTTSPITKLAVSGGTVNVLNVGGGFIAGLNSTPVNTDQAVPLGYLQSNYVPIGSGSGGIGSGTSGQTLRHNGTSWVGNSTLYNNGTNIGIGTTAPDQKLQVAGNIRLPVTGGKIAFGSAGASPSDYLMLQDIASPNPALEFMQDGASKFVIQGVSGNVGIGITNPLAKMHVNGGSFRISSSTNQFATLYMDGNGVYFEGAGDTAATNRIRFQNSNRGGAATYNGFMIGENAVGSGSGIQFYTGGYNNNRMVINETGNVGIGTTNATSKLYVNGGAANVINVGGGFVAGLNSTPVSADQAVPLGYLQANYSSTSNQLWSGALNGNIWNGTAGAGNVGIGNNAPAQKLDVTGVITASTGFRVNNAVAAAGQYLRGNGTNFVASTIQVSDVPTLNQNTTGSAYYVTSRDTRAVNDLPQDFGPLVKYDFKQNGTNGLSDGGSYNGVMTWRAYGSGSDFSGGPVMQIGYSANGNLWTRLSTGASTWGTWKKIMNSDSAVQLQLATPGTAQTGHLNVSGTGIFGGNVGIGTTSPITKLAVSGGTTNVINVGGGFVAGLNSTPVSADQAVPLGYLQANYTPITGGGYYPLTGGNLDGPIYMNATTDVDRNISNVNTLSANKLNVNVIDPLYRIKGVNYSTYASSIVGGLKEEYLGRIKVASRNTEGDYQAILDFDKVEEGSDAWVWRQVVDFAPQNIEASLTPYGGFAQVYYAVGDNSIIFHADRPVEVSYRLVGKRFDWRLWPTLSDDQDSAGYPVK